MVYYSKNSKSKVLHFFDCRHSKSLLLGDVGSFETLEEGKKAGYRMCRHCNPVLRLYHENQKAVQQYCRVNGVSCDIKKQYIRLWTPHSAWRLIATDSGGVALYHRNIWQLKSDPKSPVKGFHLQNKHCDSLLDYCRYVVKHDTYRLNNPAKRPNIPKPPAPKGSRRWRSDQKRQQQKARRRAIANVYQLISQLEAVRA